jgi:hypothetical protein
MIIEFFAGIGIAAVFSYVFDACWYFAVTAPMRRRHALERAERDARLAALLESKGSRWV